MASNADIRRELARRELARRNYIDYLRYIYSDWIDTRFSVFVAGEVQRFLDAQTGNAYDILIIESPPQHGKSRTVSESLPSWYVGKHPERRVIELSYNDDLAQRFCRRNRQHIAQYGKTLFRVEIGDVDRATDLELRGTRGSLMSRGIMGGITGNPADLILIDDPIKNREEADSETYRERLWEEWMNSVHTRLAARAKVILILTPWHEDDIAARILRTEKSARLIRLPVEAEEGDLLGRKPGEPLCPELGKGAEWLADFKAAYISDPRGGQRAWKALFQCSPRTEGGNLVKREWWRYYDDKDLPVNGRSVISLDATFKGGDDNDYVAVTVWMQSGMDFYLLYCCNQHLDFPGTVQALRTVKSLYPAAFAVLIEDKANGSAVIQTLQKEMFCIAVNPKGGKVARVNAVSPAIESGHVYVPRCAPWLEAYLEQWTAFPAGAHDDMVDSSTQALSYLMPQSGIVQIPTKAEIVREDEYRMEERIISDDAALFDVYNDNFQDDGGEIYDNGYY